MEPENSSSTDPIAIPIPLLLAIVLGGIFLLTCWCGTRQEQPTFQKLAYPIEPPGVAQQK